MAETYKLWLAEAGDRKAYVIARHQSAASDMISFTPDKFYELDLSEELVLSDSNDDQWEYAKQEAYDEGFQAAVEETKRICGLED